MTRHALQAIAWSLALVLSVAPAAAQQDAANIGARLMADPAVKAAVDEAVKDEDARWKKNVLSVDKALVGNRPAGQIPANSPIVQAAVSVTRALGFPITLDEGSTDSNIPMNLGIPTVTIDGGGRGRGAHALDENFDQTDSWQGSQRALLLAIALAPSQSCRSAVSGSTREARHAGR